MKGDRRSRAIVRLQRDNDRLREINKELLEACKEIHKFWLCPEPKTKREWAARCDVMATHARKAIAKAEVKGKQGGEHVDCS